VRADSPWRRPDGREQRSRITRRRLYEAALEEFRRVGFAAASISRITHRAGVSRPSFYFHFPTKEHVLLELQWELEHEVVERMAPLADPVAAVHAFVDGLVDVQERLGAGDVFRDLLQVWVRRPEGLDPEQHAMPVMQEVRRRFEQARAAQVLRPGVPPERAMLLFLTSVFGYLIGAGGAAAAERENLHALADLYLARGA
jgi:AcrR family transcriptional regulator